MQDPSNGDKMAEHTGGGNGSPYTIPVLYNVTCIGRGENTGKPIMEFKDNAGGKYYNSVFVSQDKGVAIEYNPYPFNSYSHLLSMNLVIAANAFFNVGNNDSLSIFYPTGTQIPSNIYTSLQSFTFSRPA